MQSRENGPLRQPIFELYKPERIKRNQIIIEQGEPVKHIFYVVKGRVEELKKGGLDDKLNLVLHTATEGGFFGIDGIIGLETHRLSATTFCLDTTIKRIPIDRAQEELEQNGKFRLLVFQRLLDQADRTALAVADKQDGNTRNRLARKLEEFRAYYGNGEQSFTVNGVSHENLGALLGVYRETISPILRSWQTQGLVKLGYREVTVFDQEALNSHVEDS